MDKWPPFRSEGAQIKEGQGIQPTFSCSATMEKLGVSVQGRPFGHDTLTPRSGNDRRLNMRCGSGSVEVQSSERAFCSSSRQCVRCPLNSSHILRAGTFLCVLTTALQSTMSTIKAQGQPHCCSQPSNSLYGLFSLPCQPQGHIPTWATESGEASSGKWRLHLKVVEEIWRIYGKRAVDLFA